MWVIMLDALSCIEPITDVPHFGQNFFRFLISRGLWERSVLAGIVYSRNVTPSCGQIDSNKAPLAHIPRPTHCLQDQTRDTHSIINQHPSRELNEEEDKHTLVQILHSQVFTLALLRSGISRENLNCPQWQLPVYRCVTDISSDTGSGMIKESGGEAGAACWGWYFGDVSAPLNFLTSSSERSTFSSIRAWCWLIKEVITAWRGWVVDYVNPERLIDERIASSSHHRRATFRTEL